MAEAPEEKQTWQEAVREQQQMFYEMFADRDWDCYKESEMVYLEMNIGHAVYGLPKELPDKSNGDTGYPEKELQHIQKICATIKGHSKCPSECSDSDVLVSIIFVCLNIDEHSAPVPVFRIPSVKPEATSLDQCLNQFVDSSCRVYKDWDDFLTNNQLPECTYCYPIEGVYSGDENDNVLLKFGKTPACKITNRVCSALDTASTVVMIGGTALGVAAMFATVGAPLVAASTVGSVTTGVYGFGRSVAALVDRSNHKQSVGVTDAEARSCWLSIAGNSLGIASGQAVRILTKMTQNGQVLCKAGRLAVNALNFGSLTVNGLGIINSIVVLREKHRSENLTPLDVFQFASSLLFFSMSAVSIKTADAIIRETQTNVISDFEASLRSNRHRRMFRRVAKHTQGSDGNTMQGNAKVIKGITHISNKDDFFAGLVRIQKQMSKSGVKASFTDTGLVEINGKLRIDPMSFSEIGKAQRQLILEATKKLSQETYTQEQFNQEVLSICKEQNVVYVSQTAEAKASVKEFIISSKNKEKTFNSQGNVLSKMEGWQLDILTQQLVNFAKEQHEIILNIAIGVADMLELKKTADLLRVVDFMVKYIKQVASEMEESYQADLQSAQLSEGDNFNQEQFDYKYHIQGNRMQHFIRIVVYNYNTIEALRYLTRGFQKHFLASEANPSTGDNAENESTAGNTFPCPSHDKNSDPEDKAVHTSASSTEDFSSKDETLGTDQACGCNTDILYKEHRDFKKDGDLSDEEIYEIAQKVTGLCLFRKDVRLLQDGMVTFVSVNNPYIVPVTVMIISDKCNDAVTASLIL